MAAQPMHLQTNCSSSPNPHRALTNLEDLGQTYRVETIVVALVPEYHQVKVRDDDGHMYALTSKTQGVDLAALHEGQRIICTVAKKLLRVLSAKALA